MKKKIKINEIFILYFVIIGIISITSVSMLTYYQYRKAILDRSFEQLTSIRNLKKYKIEGFFEDRIRDIKLLSKSTDIRSIVKSLGNNNNNGLSTSSYIYNYIFTSGYYKNITFSDFEHTICQNHNSILPCEESYKKYLKDLKAGQLFADTYHILLTDYLSDSSEEMSIIIGSLIVDKNLASGFIATGIPITAIDNIMLESINARGFGESGESYLVGNDYLMRSSSRFIPNSILKVAVETEATMDAFKSNEGTLITKDYRGIPVLSSFCRLSINNLNWIILSEIDLREVMKPVSMLRNQLLILSIILIIIVFLIGWFLSTKIASPIMRIREAAIKISKGDFPVIDAESSNEEIDELVKTFNYMSDQLKDKSEQIQAEKLKQLSSIFDGQESERKRLSYELHDGLGQSLVALKYRIESLEKQHKDLNQKKLNELNQSVSEVIEEVRQMSFNLMPAILNEFGLIPAMQNICGKLETQTGKTIVFEAEGSFETLDEKQKNYIFRIAQEVLNNAIKHAEADLISIQLIEFPDFYTMIAEDNGKGFDYNPGHPFKGNGLYSIKDRTDILKGKFIIQSIINKGTTIRIRIPK